MNHCWISGSHEPKWHRVNDMRNNIFWAHAIRFRGPAQVCSIQSCVVLPVIAHWPGCRTSPVRVISTETPRCPGLLPALTPTAFCAPPPHDHFPHLLCVLPRPNEPNFLPTFTMFYILTAGQKWREATRSPSWANFFLSFAKKITKLSLPKISDIWTTKLCHQIKVSGFYHYKWVAVGLLVFLQHHYKSHIFSNF